MKLESFKDKKETRRKMILISLGVITIIGVSLLLYKTFASFKREVTFPMMSGKVNYYGNADLIFVFYKEDQLLDEMPKKGNSEKLVFDHGTCDNGATIEWNENEWAPLVKGLNQTKTTCSLYFTENKEYYVSSNGSDGATGEKDSPLLTIKKAYENINKKGTIKLLSNVVEEEGLVFNGKEITITSEDETYEIQRGNSLTNKPILEINNQTNLTINNVIFNGLEIESTKSLIDVNNSSLTINEGTIIENGINNNGIAGGLYLKNTSTIINDGIIRNNSSIQAGGGLSLYGGSLTINGGQIINNNAIFGGGIELVNKVDFTMNGGNITDNKGNSSASNGAGIHINSNGQDGSTIKINDGIISKNISQGNGGGIGVSVNCGEITLDITGGKFLENESVGVGGGFYLSNGIKTNLTISGGTFENNKASYGGGIYLHSEKEGESVNNILETVIKGNNAISGGGLYIQSTVKNAIFNIDGATIDGNVATVTNGSGGVGGGIRFNGTNHQLTISNVNILNNQAYNGGGIYIDGKMIFNSGKIEKNKAQNGGGIYLSISELDMNDGFVNGNEANLDGGGIFINTNSQNGGVFNFNGGEISNNTSNNRGGGLKYYTYNGETTINLKGTNFIGNTAGTFGGGIDIENKNPLHFELSAGSINENKTLTNSGGGIYISALGENNIYNITGGTLNNNIATDSGGAIRYILNASNNTLNISNVIMSGNQAENMGGAMLLGAATNTNYTNNIVNLISGEISNNIGTNYAGGIIVDSLSEFNMSGGNIINNTCTSKTGTGGLYVSNNVLKYNKTGGTINGNNPTDVGGIATK